jgi:hypothetical protein
MQRVSVFHTMSFVQPPHYPDQVARITPPSSLSVLYQLVIKRQAGTAQAQDLVARLEVVVEVLLNPNQYQES